MSSAMLRLLGVDEQTGSRASRLLDELAPIARALGLEYGAIPCYVTPHNPLEGPYTARAALAAGADVELDLENTLGKWATRGHVVNTGDGPLFLDWSTPVRDALHGDYKLQSGAALDLSSFVVTRLRIRAGPDQASEYQVLAQ